MTISTASPSDERAAVLQTAQRAREAAVVLRTLTRDQKDAALQGMADALVAAAPIIVAANATDISRAQEAGTSAAIVDRLTLTEARIRAIAHSLRDVAGLPGPVGEVVR